MVFNGWIKGLEEVKRKRDEIVISSVKELEKFILELNKQQLWDGKRRDGSYIHEDKPYTSFTVKIKSQIGQPTDRVTLKDTGDFYESFYIVYSKDFFIIYAKDPKTGKLLTKYKDEVMGLTDDNLQKVIDRIKPIIMQKTKKLINEFTNKRQSAAI